MEFIKSNASALRMSPICEEGQVGNFEGELPRMTKEAIKEALAQLSASERNRMAEAERLEMCILSERTSGNTKSCGRRIRANRSRG